MDWLASEAFDNTPFEQLNVNRAVVGTSLDLKCCIIKFATTDEDVFQDYILNFRGDESNSIEQLESLPSQIIITRLFNIGNPISKMVLPLSHHKPILKECKLSEILILNSEVCESLIWAKSKLPNAIVTHNPEFARLYNVNAGLIFIDFGYQINEIFYSGTWKNVIIIIAPVLGKTHIQNFMFRVFKNDHMYEYSTFDCKVNQAMLNELASYFIQGIIKWPVPNLKESFKKSKPQTVKEIVETNLVEEVPPILFKETEVEEKKSKRAPKRKVDKKEVVAKKSKISKFQSFLDNFDEDAQSQDVFDLLKNVNTFNSSLDN